MGQTTVVSGGSAANTIIGAAHLGCRAGFIGKVKTDPLGAIFTHDIRSAGVTFKSAPAKDWRGERALPCVRHARRPAHDEHFSRRLPESDAAKMSIPIS